MGLLDLLGKRIKKAPIQDELLDHLTPEGELPWGWFAANKEFIHATEAEFAFFLQQWVNSKDKPLKDQYAALKSLVLYMKGLQSLCASKGECFSYWLTALFTEKDIEERSERLKYIEDHFGELEAQYEKSAYIKAQVVNLVSANPGILQTEVYKHFGPEDKTLVANEIYMMAASNILIREKSGHTYSLKMNQSK